MTVLDYLYVNCSISTIAKLDDQAEIQHLDDITKYIPDFGAIDALGDMSVNYKIIAPLACAVIDIGKYLANQLNRKFIVAEKDDSMLLMSIGEPTFYIALSGKKVLLREESDYLCGDQTYEVACVCAAYAVRRNEKCAAAMKLYAEKRDSRTLAIAHKVILDYLCSEELIIGIGKWENERYDSNGFIPLQELIASVDYQKIFKSEKPITKERYAPITRKFSPAEFPEKFEDDRGVVVDKKYRLSEKFHSLCRGMVDGTVKSVLLNGPAGTGKSLSAKLVCREIGLPVMAVVNCTANTDEFILGKHLPIDGELRFCESDVTRAVRNGGAVIFEEINFAKPQYLSFLNSLLDDNEFIQLDTGEYVKRHKNFRFFATMNDGYAGTNKINEALLNRMDIIWYVPEMEDSFIKQTLVTEVPSCEKNVDKMLSVFHKIKALFEDNAYDGTISIRNLLSWAKMAMYEDYISAAEKTVLGCILGEPELRAAGRDILNIFTWD